MLFVRGSRRSGSGGRSAGHVADGTYSHLENRSEGSPLSLDSSLPISPVRCGVLSRLSARTAVVTEFQHVSLLKQIKNRPHADGRCAGLTCSAVDLSSHVAWACFGPCSGTLVPGAAVNLQTSVLNAAACEITYPIASLVSHGQVVGRVLDGPVRWSPKRCVLCWRG